MPKFHPDFCLNCGALLRGLPGEGTCPRCQTPYDEHAIIWRAANPWRFFWIGLCSQILFWVMCVPSPMIGSSWWSMAIGMAIYVLFVGAWVVGLARSVRARRRGLCVWIERRGVGVRDPENDVLIFWADLLYVTPQGIADAGGVRIDRRSGSIVVHDVFKGPAEVMEFLAEFELARERYDPDHRATSDVP